VDVNGGGGVVLIYVGNVQITWFFRDLQHFNSVNFLAASS
jgi:hypothetical protein